ncbi:MAG: C69 family dipeptidase [Bacteroidales bacterium]|nr:C69 family dipeptidase [Bacteroidales bacterium]
MNRPQLVIALLAAAFLAVPGAEACTNFLFSRGATVDGSTIITYAADSHTRYGQLRYCPAADHRAGEQLQVYDYGSQKYLMSIPQVGHTYSVVGFMNEFQLAIGETTWGGRPEVEKGNDRGIDYGSLIFITLQRARNAREAITVIDNLVQTYGYTGGGETFSIADPNEVWIFEIVAKTYEKGAVWVARRVPEGYACAHANQARITIFPQETTWNHHRGRGYHKTISSEHIDYIDEPEVECVYSHDVVTAARINKWYDGLDRNFSFADTYNPLTFSGLRACESRVWSMFNRIKSGMEDYLPYVMGDPTAMRLPLWIKPDKRVSLHDVMELMRDHFEGTPMDMTGDPGAGPYHCPYRWRPMEFEVDGQKYIHERAISTQQTGFSFVAQCRSWLPAKVGGVLWFGVDDTYSTCYCPMYCGLTQVPVCFEEGNGSMSEYSETAAFWLFNRVSNFAYLRYDSMIEDIRKVQQQLETKFIEHEKLKSDALANTYNTERLQGEINRFCNMCAEDMMRQWHKLDQHLLLKYIDGNIKHETPDGRIETTETGVVRFPMQPDYPEWLLRLIVESRGGVLKKRNF